VFLWSRLAVWGLAAFTVLVFERELNPNRARWDSARLHELGAVFDVWARWDSDWYLRIAESGYDWPSSSPAFFPLYPLLVGGVGRLLDGHYRRQAGPAPTGPTPGCGHPDRRRGR
jgi:hypothetical protein